MSDIPVVKKKARKNLVITQASSDSQHCNWIDNHLHERSFDLIILSQEKDIAFSENCQDELISFSAETNADYLSWFRENPWIFDVYSYIAILNERVIASQQLIDRLFAYVEALGVSIAQPALMEKSPYREVITRCHGSFLHRWTNWVEFLAPVFKASYLRNCTSSSRLSSLLTGNEFIWSSSCHNIPGDIAIIDAIPIEWCGDPIDWHPKSLCHINDHISYFRARLMSAQTGTSRSVDNICGLTKDGRFLHLGEEAFLRLIAKDIQNQGLSFHPIKDLRGDWISTRMVYNTYLDQLHENIRAMQENAASDHLNNSLSIAAMQAGMLYETLSRI